MGIFRRKKKVGLHDVPTTASQNVINIDRNRDGVPDFLQRPEIPSLIKTVSDTILSHVDAQKEIENMMMGWAGYSYDTEKRAYVPRNPPVMRFEGVAQLGAYIGSVINKLVMNANLSEEYAHKQTAYHSYAIIEMLADNKIRWEISHTQLTPISEQCDSFIYAVLSRAINDRQRQHDTDRMRLTGDVRPQNSQPVI